MEWTVGDSSVAICIEVRCLCVEQHHELLQKTSKSYYSAADIETNITNKEEQKKKEWTKSWFVRNKSCFTTICNELTVKLYTNNIKIYIRMPE